MLLLLLRLQLLLPPCAYPGVVGECADAGSSL